MKNNKKIIVIIPARGGSKRFPNKNIYPLNGKPLISYPIEVAKNSSYVDRVIVSTDSEKIAEVAKQYGAEIPFLRPKDLARDISPTIDAVKYTVKTLKDKFKYCVDYVVLLQATTPLIEVKHIDNAIDLAIKKNADSVINVTSVDTINHPYNIRHILEDGIIDFWQRNLHYEYLSKKKPQFYKAANLWLSSYDTIVKHNKLEGEKNYPIIVDSIYSLDIDYKEDLELIEAWLQYKNKKYGKKKKNSNS